MYQGYGLGQEACVRRMLNTQLLHPLQYCIISVYSITYCIFPPLSSITGPVRNSTSFSQTTLHQPRVVWLYFNPQVPNRNFNRNIRGYFYLWHHWYLTSYYLGFHLGGAPWLISEVRAEIGRSEHYWESSNQTGLQPCGISLVTPRIKRIVYQDFSSLVSWFLHSTADITFNTTSNQVGLDVTTTKSLEWPTDTRNAGIHSHFQEWRTAFLWPWLVAWFQALSFRWAHVSLHTQIGSDPLVVGRMQYSALTRPSMIILPTSYAVGRW